MVLTSLVIYQGVFNTFRFYGVRTNQQCKDKHVYLICKFIFKISTL